MNAVFWSSQSGFWVMVLQKFLSASQFIVYLFRFSETVHLDHQILEKLEEVDLSSARLEKLNNSMSSRFRKTPCLSTNLYN